MKFTRVILLVGCLKFWITIHIDIPDWNLFDGIQIN